jgi:ribosomal protein S18 acetylase RimI-like enzyme
MLTATFREQVQDRQGASYIARDLEPGDREKLIAMYTDFEPKRAAQGLPPVGEAKIRIWLNRVLPKGRHVVIEANGLVRGHIMLMPHENEGLELANFLHQSIRGRGLGTALNGLALRLAQENGADRVWLSVELSNRAAVRSYENVGFRRVPGSLWLPEIEMVISLP